MLGYFWAGHLVLVQLAQVRGVFFGPPLRRIVCGSPRASKVGTGFEAAFVFASELYVLWRKNWDGATWMWTTVEGRGKIRPQ